MSAPLRLRRLPFGARLSLTCLMLVTLGGYAASGLYMQDHHQNRDGTPGLTKTDIEGVYHGVTVEAPLGRLIEVEHPKEKGLDPMNEFDRAQLTEWLKATDQIVENWQNIDFGDGSGSPEEIVTMSCGKCHGPGVSKDDWVAPLLGSWDDYKPMAFQNEVSPTDEAILLASTHAHSLALGTITLLICALMYATRMPGIIKGLLTVLASAGLLFDLGAWWLARDNPAFIDLIIAGGAAHAGAMGLMMVLVILDAWLPGGRGGAHEASG